MAMFGTLEAEGFSVRSELRVGVRIAGVGSLPALSLPVFPVS